MQKWLKFVLSTTMLALSIQTVQAETKYVTENLSTFLRKGAGDNYRLAGSIQAGEEITVLEQKDKFTLIRDRNNREAWILTNELTDVPSSKHENPRLKAQVQELTNKLNRIDDDWQRRTTEMQRRAKDADQKSNQLLEENSQLKREVEILKNKNRDLETILDAGKREIAIQWFIYGGAVLAVGLILGLIIPAILPKRRRSGGGW
ncbi:MAG TPA: hypothetical protein DD638_10385 [Pasteurellaceae bacterium]|nr:hypothetical protein [Pasteurellaceae bacterium]